MSVCIGCNNFPGVSIYLFVNYGTENKVESGGGGGGGGGGSKAFL